MEGEGRDNLIGRRFGNLVVIRKSEDYIRPNKRHLTQYLCQCDCGSHPKNILKTNLIRGLSTSCGKCKTKERWERLRAENVFNQYIFKGDLGIGFTSNNDKFYFDKEYYDLIKDYTWYITDTGYVASDTKKHTDGRILLHRLLMNPDKNETVDHIDHNKTNNRISNLRVATQAQNNRNRKPTENRFSRTTGVGWNKKRGKWRSYIGIDHKFIDLGFYENIEDAVAARKAAEEKYFGEYSYDNSMKIAKSTEQMLAKEREKIKLKETNNTNSEV